MRVGWLTDGIRALRKETPDSLSSAFCCVRTQ